VLSSNMQENGRACKHQVNPAALSHNNVNALLAVSVNIQEKHCDHRWHRKQKHLLRCRVSRRVAKHGIEAVIWLEDGARVDSQN
jgi:hypothetical protein